MRADMDNPIVQSIMLFNRLSKYPAGDIYNAIKDETAQVIAVILTRFDAKKSREILEHFPSADQKDIVFRMASAKDVPPEFINEIANIIGNKLRYLESEDTRATVQGQDKMAEILKHMGTSKSQALLDALGKKDTDMADRISRKMFKFDDIGKLELKGLQHALSKVEIDILAIALKGASDEVKTAVWEALSVNRRKHLRDEMKYLGPQKRSDVDRARSDMMSVFRGFYDQGILRLQSDPSDDEWV